ncbi:hypothetical protein RI367_005405 [Sorochytrium milnesiophthora]
MIIRVALPNDQTTVVQAQYSMSAGDVFHMICERRNLPVADHVMKIVFQDGTDTPAEFDRKLSEYDMWKSVVVERKDTGGEATLGLPGQNAPRRKSTINAPTSKGMSIRASSVVFPRTLASPSEAQAKLGEFEAVSDTAFNISPAKARFKTLRQFLRRNKDSSDSMLDGDGYLTANGDQSGLAPMSPGTSATSVASATSPNGGPSTSTSSRSLADGGEHLVSQMRGRTFSRRSAQSQIENSSAFSTSDRGSIDMAVSPEEGRTSPVSTLARGSTGEDIRIITRRALQSPIDISVTGDTLTRFRSSSSGSGTMRRSPNRRTTRLDFGNVHIYDSLPTAAPPSVKLHTVDVHLPDARTVQLFVDDSVQAEVLLQYVCRHHGIEYQTHTLELVTSKGVVEMDKTIAVYAEKDGIKAFAVVDKPKTYNTLCISEDDKDVMILQVTSGKIKILAATDQKLIEQITDTHDLATQVGLTSAEAGMALSPDADYDYNFLDTFLMTYRSFMKPPELFGQLVSRFNAELPENPTADDREYFQKNKLPTQLRAVQAVGIWVENYWHDFALDGELSTELDSFLTFILELEPFSEAAQAIMVTKETQVEEYDRMFSEQRLALQKSKTMQSLFATPKPPSAQEIAEQLCYYDFKLFMQIHPIEYLNQIWRAKNEEDSSTPNLDFFITRFDLVRMGNTKVMGHRNEFTSESYWVATEICTTKDLKLRTALIARFIDVTRYCLDMNNFFSTFAMIAGLGMRPVERLRKTWKGLSDDTRAKYDELLKICDPSRNMKNYRDRLAQAKAPIVPFLPIYLKDLTFLNDGNESRVHGLINFDKLAMMSDRVKEITQARKSRYSVTVDRVLQNYLKKPPTERDLRKLKEMSLELEPDK